MTITDATQATRLLTTRPCVVCLQVAGRLDHVLSVYKSLADCFQHDATLQIDRSGWLISPTTRATRALLSADKLYQHSLTLSGYDPSHREVGRQTVSATGATNTPCTRRTHAHPRSVDFVSGSRSNILHRSAQYNECPVPGEQSYY